MIASSDQNRKVPKTLRMMTATMAMIAARPRVAAASTFSTRVSTRSKRCTLISMPRTGMAGWATPVRGWLLLGVLLGEQVVDQVLPDDPGVLLPYRRHHAVLERLPLLGGQLED